MGIRYSQVCYRSSLAGAFTVIAHRGASAYFPENTLPSFEGALVMDADMVELDVQRTSDGTVVVFHDAKIDRCTDGTGTIADHRLADLKRLDAGRWFHRRFAGTRVPMLEEVLAVCRGRIAVNIEIKTEAVTDAVAGGIEEATLAIVDRMGMRGHVYYSSFDPRAITHLKALDPASPAAVLFEKGHYGRRRPAAIAALLGADGFNCSHHELTEAWRADAAGAGLPVHVYTVDDRRRMRSLIARGVSGIFTNKPDVLRQVVDDGPAPAARIGGAVR